jgi:hypothetical protein
MIVLRITRHALDADRKAYLQKVFGEAVEIVTEDIPYGNDPINAVNDLIGRVELAHDGERAVAVEAQAPLPILMKLVDQQGKLGVSLIRAAFERDSTGRAIVVGKDEGGRDLLKFSHYEVLEKIEFKTRPL